MFRKNNLFRQLIQPVYILVPGNGQRQMFGFNSTGSSVFGTGADGSLTVSGTTTVTMRQIYENDNVTGITTKRGAGKGLNKGSGTYMFTSESMPNFSSVTINSGQKIIGDTSNRYADAGHTFFKCLNAISGSGLIDESGCGGAGGAGGHAQDMQAHGGSGGKALSAITSGGNGCSVFWTTNSNATAGLNNSGGGGGGYRHLEPISFNGGSGGNSGAGGAGGGGGGKYVNAAVIAGAGGHAGYGTAGLPNGSENQGGVGANGANTGGCAGGGGGTYGSINFGNNKYNLAGSQFYISSGGGGGGGFHSYTEHSWYLGGAGGDGGGKIKIFAKEIAPTIGIYANGVSGNAGNGSYGASGAGGSGAGGSIWIISPNASCTLSAIGGTGAGAGRIRIDGTYTGTTNPAVGYVGTL